MHTTTHLHYPPLSASIHFHCKQGVCHRDLKPENILICDASGAVKITDFGLSAMCGSGRSHRRQRSICGTPNYTAPEVFLAGAKGDYDARKVDVWSAGVVLFAMLAGQLPVEGASQEHALRMIATDEVCHVLRDSSHQVL